MRNLVIVCLSQGLANLYEKTEQTDFKADLPQVYQKLIQLYERWAVFLYFIQTSYLLFTIPPLCSFLIWVWIVIRASSCVYSSDKTKCYEAIQKLSDIYHAQKNYLQVCISLGSPTVCVVCVCTINRTPIGL